MKKQDASPPQNANMRRLVRWQELTLALAVAVAGIGFFALRRQQAPPGNTARIFLQSEEIFSISLQAGDDYRIDLLSDYGVPVSFEVAGGGIRFVDVTCPDHLCEKAGWITAEGETAVCMPNRVAVHVVAQPDGASG